MNHLKDMNQFIDEGKGFLSDFWNTIKDKPGETSLGDALRSDGFFGGIPRRISNYISKKKEPKIPPRPYGNWDEEKAWLDKYRPGWLEKSQREMEEYRKEQARLVDEANAEYGKYLEGCPFKITNITDDGDDQGITYYEIESENSGNENEIFFTLVYYDFRKYAILLVKRRREEGEIDEGMWDYEIKRQIKMPDIETGLKWVKRNWRKPLDTKNTDTVKDEDSNRNPGWGYDYQETYKRKEPLKHVNAPDTSTFDNYKYNEGILFPKRKEPKVWNMWEHNGWGNSINWFDWDKRLIYGHMTPKPEKGDIVRSKMNSGRICKFQIRKIDYKNDPPDMFFATVKEIGYED